MDVMGETHHQQAGSGGLNEGRPIHSPTVLHLQHDHDHDYCTPH